MSNHKDQFGDRMKTYEAVSKNFLMRRTPAIIRLDGKAFHTWTRHLNKPFDGILSDLMAKTMKYLVDNIQGAVVGYTQSDEISILIRDYDTLTTDMWFGGNIQKITSVSASYATAAFNNFVSEIISDQPLAFFDSRVFSLPPAEVNNYFYWRQIDCYRNSIQACGQKWLGHKTCQKINNKMVLEKLLKLDTPIDFNEITIHFTRGMCYNKNSTYVDTNIPFFNENVNYIEQHVYIPDLKLEEN